MMAMSLYCGACGADLGRVPGSICLNCARPLYWPRMEHTLEKATDSLSKACEGRMWGLPPRETQSCLLHARRGLLVGIPQTALGQID